MKPLLHLFVFVALTAAATSAPAHEARSSKGAARTTTVTGEIVDMGCYLSHGSHGPDHKSCASRCLASGMPIGLLTADDKLYLLTLNHDDPDPYNRCKQMAAENVRVTGMLEQRNGLSAIDVADVRPAK